MTTAAGLICGDDGLRRCFWATGTDYEIYHDTEWGFAVHGEQALLERIILEAFQSGLSWLTILRKREAFRSAFDGFDPEVVAQYGPDDIERLMQDEQIVRNRRKVAAAITNARATLTLRGRGGLDDFFWSYAPDQHTRPATSTQVPTSTAESTALAKALKQAGFAHVGPTTMYAAMQACGVVDDHLLGCHRAQAAQ